MEKKLKPSLREDKRYLLLEVEGNEKINVEQSILEFLGTLGYAKVSPQFIKQGDAIILAINREELDRIRAAFAISKKRIHVKKVSGTLKGLMG
mgnify:CR=1 FL=1